MKAKSGEDLYFCQTCFSNSGISIWQGPHHVAQKFTTTTLPVSAASEKVPAVPSTEMAGILSPTLVRAVSWSAPFRHPARKVSTRSAKQGSTTKWRGFIHSFVADEGGSR